MNPACDVSIRSNEDVKRDSVTPCNILIDSYLRRPCENGYVLNFNDRPTERDRCSSWEIEDSVGWSPGYPDLRQVLWDTDALRYSHLGDLSRENR